MITEEEFVAGMNILMSVEILMKCLKGVWRTTISWPLFTERATRITVTSTKGVPQSRMSNNVVFSIS